MVDLPFVKSISILKLGPFNGGHIKSDCSDKTTVSINGLVNNLVIQSVEFSVMFAGSGEYNFNIKDSTSLVTIVFPKLSSPLSDNVKLSSSHDETIICSSLPKFARCVKYLLSFSGSVNFTFSTNASNKVFLSISSSNLILDNNNDVFISYSFPTNSTAPLLLYGFNNRVTLSLPAQFENLLVKSFKFILILLFAGNDLNNGILLLSFAIKSISTEETANEFHSTSYSKLKSENEGTSILLGNIIWVIDGKSFTLLKLTIISVLFPVPYASLYGTTISFLLPYIPAKSFLNDKLINPSVEGTLILLFEFK